MTLFFIVCFFLAESTSLYATHAMGADLTYQRVAPGYYTITLKFYRDCDGIQAPQDVDIDCISTSCGVTESRTLVKVGGPTLVPTACNMQTTCQGGALYGAEEHIYSLTVPLDSTCTDWKFAFSVCCRNGAISTLASANTYDLYIEANHSDMSSGIYNSSPVFGSLPIVVACVGETVHYNHGVYEIDGDSLSFSLVNGLHDPNTIVPYVNGLSGANPLFTTNPITIDSKTGAIEFIPSQVQVGVLSVLVREYRNGIEIGTVTRDIQLLTVNCLTNSAPIASGIDGTANSMGTTGLFSTTVPEGSPFCFDVATYDAEGNNLTIDNVSPNGSTFSVDPLTNTATFCWTPTNADIGTHLLTIIVEDDGCDYVAKNSYVYAIEVAAIPCFLNGVVNYWDDENKLLAGIAGNNETAIHVAANNCGLEVPSTTASFTDAAGSFSHDMSLGNLLHLNRDVDNANCNPSWGVIEANDAFLANVFALADSNFVPNPYQVIAMDVDMNGRVDSLDVEQILDRSISTICEFNQAWTIPNSSPAKDWRFTEKNIANGADYMISSSFPASDNVGYSNTLVPSVPNCLDVTQPGACSSWDTVQVQACLLGDVDGNWNATSNAPIFKGTPFAFTMNLTQAAMTIVNGECVYTVDIMQGIPSAIKSFNFDIDYDESQISLVNIIPGNSMLTEGKIKWNTVGSERALVGAFANKFNGVTPSGPLFSLQFTSVNNFISTSDFTSVQVRKNGSNSDVLVEGMTTLCSTTSNDDIIRSTVTINPNPASGQTIIDYRSYPNEINTITLWNTQGQLVRTIQPTNSGITELSVNDLSAGVYILRMNEIGFRILVL